jgi:RNA polymerase sigma factor (sigma-70 family)
MVDQDLELNNLQTHWSSVLSSAETEGHQARNRLLVRYHDMIQRYVRAKLAPDIAAADALVSDFAMRVLELDAFLRRATPGDAPRPGRFRKYLLTVLSRMVTDHFRRKTRDGSKRKDFSEGSDLEPISIDEPADDPEFLACWKQELVNQAWKALESTEKRSGQLFYTLVMYQQANPDLTWAQIAERFSAERGESFTAAGVRQIVKRGRELFGEMLVHETARSLEKERGATSASAIEGELIELGLLNDYCKSALEHWGGEK